MLHVVYFKMKHISIQLFFCPKDIHPLSFKQMEVLSASCCSILVICYTSSSNSSKLEILNSECVKGE